MKERNKKEIGDAVERLNVLQSKVMVLGLSFILLCIADAVCLLAYSRPAGGAGAVVLGLYYILYLRKIRKKYQHDFVEETLLSGAAVECSELAFDENKEQLGAIASAALFPLAREKGISLFKGFRASYKQLKVLGNEGAIQVEPVEKSGGNSKLHIISGSIFTITSDGAKGDEEILVYEKSVPTGKHHQRLLSGGYVMAGQLGYETSCDKIAIYLPGKTEMTTELEEKLQKVERLANKLEIPFALDLAGNRVICVFGGIFYAQDISPRYSISERALKMNRMPELGRLLKFAEEMLNK